MSVSAGSQPRPVSFWSPLRSVPPVREVTLRQYLPALRGCFTVSLAVFNIRFPRNRPLASSSFQVGAQTGTTLARHRASLKLLASSAAWPGSGWQPPGAWLQRRTFRSVRAGKIARCWITFQKGGNKIPRKPLSVLLCSSCLVLGFFFFLFLLKW